MYNLFVAVLGLCRCTGLFLVRVHGLLIATASLVDEHKPYSTGSVVVVHGMWDFSRSGIKPHLLHWQADSFTTEPPGKPNMCSLELRTYPLSPSNFHLPHVKVAMLK